MLLRVVAAAVSGTLVLVPLHGDEPAVTTIKSVVTLPRQFSNRTVRLAGRFSGLAAGLVRVPRPPTRNRWDFVLEQDGACVWVTGRRPVGRDFDLDPRSLADSQSGRWLVVTGTVRVGIPGSPVWVQASDMQSIRPSGAIDTGRARAAEPPKIVFHDPVSDEPNVSVTTPVRLQFSRRMAAETFSGRVRISYASPRRLLAQPIPAFTASYRDDRRGLEIRFAAPLDRGQVVRVELLDGIRTTDGRTLERWALTFRTGA